MKYVVFEDSTGRLRRVKLPDNEQDVNKGVPASIDLCMLDWDEIIRMLNNLMIEEGVFTDSDVRYNRQKIDMIVRNVITRRLVGLAINQKL